MSKPQSFCEDLTLLPNDKSLALTKMKAVADDKCNVAKMIFSAFYSLENILRKGENAVLTAFSPFPTMFSNASCFRVVKTRDCFVNHIFLPK